MEFDALERLRRFLAEIAASHLPSLKNYYDPESGGFRHRHDDTKKLSTASTATCVASLVARGLWDNDLKWHENSQKLAETMLTGKWSSSRLPEKNPFTTAFVLEAVTSLQSYATTLDDKGKIHEGDDILLASIADGRASILDYPPSAYLTQLVVRVLTKRNKLGTASKPDGPRENVRRWAWREIDHQLSLFQAGSKAADVFQLAYSIIIAASLGEPESATPDETSILQAALKELFKRQLPDGSWPRSQPLFHYPGVGSAYCYEYEMLTQLLTQETLHDKLLNYLDKFSTSCYALRDSQFPLKGGGLGWSSGHHPQLSGPESWSTASVYHFAHVLDRLVAEAIRRAIFEYLDTPYVAPRAALSEKAKFAPKFVDCEVRIDSIAYSLRDVVFDKFVRPVAAQAPDVEGGMSMRDDTPVAAIFFGPPGTSKTELTQSIAQYLQWPRLTVDPSHFVRHGLDKVQAEADRLFKMFAVAERIVILLDEFDEMVRERNTATEVLSRFLTTSMLPRLATITKHRRSVFIVATNHIEQFDLAISRPGRFDLIIPIFCPTTAAKLAAWPKVEKRLSELKVDIAGDVASHLAALTFLEFKALAPRLEAADNGAEAMQLINHAFTNGTLNSPVDPRGGAGSETWLAASEKQTRKMRIPN